MFTTSSDIRISTALGYTDGAAASCLSVQPVVYAGSANSIVHSTGTTPPSQTVSSSAPQVGHRGPAPAAATPQVDASDSTSQHASTSAPAAARGAWDVQYRQEVGLHTMAALVAMRGEMLQVLNELPAVVRAFLSAPAIAPQAAWGVHTAGPLNIVAVRVHLHGTIHKTQIHRNWKLGPTATKICGPTVIELQGQ